MAGGEVRHKNMGQQDLKAQSGEWGSWVAADPFLYSSLLVMPGSLSWH